MPNQIRHTIGEAGEDWLRAQNKKAWEKILQAQGKEIIAGLENARGRALSGDELKHEMSAWENAFNHVHGAALVRALTGVDAVTRWVGDEKEKNQWGKDSKADSGRRDVYGDLWNDEVGLAIGRRPDADLAKESFEAVRDGTAIIRKGADPVAATDPTPDGRPPPAFDGDVRLQGVHQMSLDEMFEKAPAAARTYLDAWSKARTTPYPYVAPLPVKGPLPLG